MSGERSPVLPDPWQGLRRHTPARIALGRSGAGLGRGAALASESMRRDLLRRPMLALNTYSGIALQPAGHSRLFEHCGQ